MRWKLLLIASLVATLVGAGATLGIVIGVLNSSGQFTAPDMAVLRPLDHSGGVDHVCEHLRLSPHGAAAQTASDGTRPSRHDST